MSRTLSTILSIAFLVAAVSSYLVYKVTAKEMRATQLHTTRIIVAGRDLQIGSVIRDLDLTTREWVGSVPRGALVARDAVVGRGVMAQIYEGEPILENRLAAAGSGGGLAATIRPGMRACAVRVDDVVGVAGFVVPGMRVDVLVSGNSPGASQTNGPKVRTLLQNIEVLSAGTNIQKNNEGRPEQVPVVNLLVTPEEAELLSLASNQTKIQLVLRNPLDTDTPETPAIAMASLFSEDNVPKPKPAVIRKPVEVDKPVPPRTYLVQVLNGGKQTEAKFTDSGQQQ